MILKNKKGYMLVEIILASAIAFAIAAYLFSVTIKLKNKNDDLLVENIVSTNSAIVNNYLLKKINEDPNNFDCGLITVDDDLKTIRYNGEVITIYDKYGTIRPSLSYCKDAEIDGSAQIYIGIDVPQMPDKNFDITIDFIKRRNDSPNTLFEGVGYYGFAMAGSNNATRGNDFSSAWDTNRWLKIPPTDALAGRGAAANYTKIENELKASKYMKDKYKFTGFTNITGSKLDTKGGIAKKVIFSYFAYGAKGSGTAFEGDIIMIKPDFSYIFIPHDEARGWGSVGYLDITDYIDRRHPDGWYYVSFINSCKAPQTAWSVTALYENKEKTPYSYAKLVLEQRGLGQNASTEIMFKNRYELTGTYQITGTILAGGVSAWAVDGETEDKVEAILKDGSKKQLYEMTYKGKKIFEGRTNKDFANGTFNTIMNHNPNTDNTKGGELDIFYETLDDEFFGGKSLEGVKITKLGKNAITAGLLGVSMSITKEN